MIVVAGFAAVILESTGFFVCVNALVVQEVVDGCGLNAILLTNKASKTFIFT